MGSRPVEDELSLQAPGFPTPAALLAALQTLGPNPHTLLSLQTPKLLLLYAIRGFPALKHGPDPPPPKQGITTEEPQPVPKLPVPSGYIPPDSNKSFLSLIKTNHSCLKLHSDRR